MRENIFYFDYASTTPIDPAILRAMQPYFTKDFGNPSNLYELGRRAREAIEEARRKISRVLNCRPDELIFTGSATEADNLAIAGTARANRELGNKIIISNIEHKAVLATCRQLAKEGFDIAELPVGRSGLVNPEELEKILDEKTILVSIMYANNEIGTIQPIGKIGKLINGFREKKHSPTPFFHTDAAQALQFLDCDTGKLGVDLLTLSSHKLYGPKGVGGLFHRQSVSIAPIIYGGSQQQSFRPGTENVAGIVGLGCAVALAQKNRKAESARLESLRDQLEKGIFKTIPKVILNGHPTRRLPNFLNISILDIEGEALLLYLDKKGVMAGTGSACNSETLEPSYVLAALGHPYEYIHGSLRFTLGKYTKNSDVDYVLKTLPEIVAKLRKLSPINLKLGRKEKISRPQAFVGGELPHFLRKK
jgi:cysteine desulfurase